jgi:hypothetical protein
LAQLDALLFFLVGLVLGASLIWCGSSRRPSAVAEAASSGSSRDENDDDFEDDESARRRRVQLALRRKQ